jgi:hypothetical protein
VILAMNCRNSEKWFLVEGEVLETQSFMKKLLPLPLLQNAASLNPNNGISAVSGSFRRLCL